MLYEFLVENRERILAFAQRQIPCAAQPQTRALTGKGLPQFYDHLVRELERGARGQRKRSPCRHGQYSTGFHGQELARLGYTVAQIVQGYDVLCRAITKLAHGAPSRISAGELDTINQKLDLAIAEAITGFAQQTDTDKADSVKRMGFLVHELRNALAAATVAHAMITKGAVDISGSTNGILERNLSRMREIRDRSFAEVRMRHERIAEFHPVPLFELASEVEATAMEDARQRGLVLCVNVDPRLQVDGDRHYLISALSNLVQNAIKYSKQGGTIHVRSRETDTKAVLEVEDRCGGLPKGRITKLFQPFIQEGSDRSGLGLGLSICRRAVALNKGTLSVRDFPGKGCVFSIHLPKRSDRHEVERARREALHGRRSYAL